MGLLISEKGHLDREKPTITEEYITNASTVYLEMVAFVGGLTYQFGSLVWTPPAIHSTGLVCVSADYSIDWQNEDPNNTDMAHLTVNYSIPEFGEQNHSDDSEDVGTIKVELAGSVLQLEKGEYTWSSGSKSGKKLGDTDTKPFKIVPEGHMTVKFNSKIDVNLAAFMPLYGKINEFDLAVPGISQVILAECARFDGVETERKFTTQGYPFFEVSFKFAIAAQSWNKVWDGTAWSTTTPDIYETADFSGLFSA